MSYIKYWLKTHKKRDYQKIIARKEEMHVNSKETMEFMKKHDLFNQIDRVFEIGCGSGRNLAYMLREKPELQIGANDLIRKACFAHMEDIVKEKIAFKQQDTRSIFEEGVPECDLLLAHDHIMHLDRETVEVVLEKIVVDPKPRFILLREPKEERIEHKPVRLVHDFSKLNEIYEVQEEFQCNSDTAYYLRLYRRKQEV